MEADSWSRRTCGRLHELPDRSNDLDELFIVRANTTFDFIQPAGDFGIGSQDFSDADEGPHDFDVTCTARSLRRTLESIATPCSVKA